MRPHRPSPPTFEHGRVFAIATVPAFLIAWPIARSLLDWLVNGSGLLPSDIEPITTSPLDVVLIQLRTAVALVSIVLGGLVLLDLTRFAAQSDAVRTRMDELDLRRIRPALGAWHHLGLCPVARNRRRIFAWIPHPLPARVLLIGRLRSRR